MARHREVTDEGDRSDGSGCGNGRDEAGGSARAAGAALANLSGANYGDAVVQVFALEEEVDRIGSLMHEFLDRTINKK
jgi:hypothetical protein